MTNLTPPKNTPNNMREKKQKEDKLYSYTNNKTHTNTKRIKNPKHNIYKESEPKRNRSGKNNNKTYHGHKNQTLHHTLSQLKNNEKTKKKTKLNDKYEKENKY